MLRAVTRSLGALTALAVFSAGCTDADLERIQADLPFRDDKLSVSGSLCTRDPGTRVFPLRVLFVVDSSESMLVTDPGDPVSGETGRERAVRTTWETLLEGGPEGVRVGVIRFSAEASAETPVDEDMDGLPDTYYTANSAQLEAATASLRVTDRTTNYLNALSEAYFEMRTELTSAELESLPLSKYAIVFVSDGLPDTDSSEERENSNENILEAVDQLVELADLFRIGDFSLHTAYLSAGEGPAVDQAAQELLQTMAERGGGNYRNFPSGESLSFFFAELNVIRRVFTLKTLSAINTSAMVDGFQVAPYLIQTGMGLGDGATPDGGLPFAGSDAGLPSTIADAPDPRRFVDVDGNSFPSCGEPLVDSDSDGLSDLMEEELGSDAFIPDSDDDGLSDYIEWSLRDSGLDPMEPTDAQCFVPDACIDANADGACDCLIDTDTDGVCDCVSNPNLTCVDALGHDCVDADADGFCDCPDADADGRCDYPDRDGDTLNDCAEVFFGTASNGNDTDADGFPDPLEVLRRSNPVDADRLSDQDWDLTRNGTEVLAATDPWCDDTGVRSLVSQRYTLDNVGLSDGQNCYEFDVSNIILVPTAPNAAAPNPGNGWNRVLLYAGEVSFDDPDSFAAYRVACVMVNYEPEGNYKNPPSGRVVLRDEDFVDFRTFEENRDCIWP